MSLPRGTRLGPYEVSSLLGAGGMGEVYRARDTRLGRDVAVKVLPETLAASEPHRRRIEQEARTISHLSHPHICALYDVGREGDAVYLVMELIEGETLEDRLSKGPLPLAQAYALAIEICSALDAAHRKGIVHRDLKPGNIMLTKAGVKLLDFGLAKALAPDTPPNPLTEMPTEAATPKTADGAVVGTLAYMSPEQLEGRPVDERTDLFALGAVLYEMVTGRRAFNGKSAARVASEILSSEPAPPSSVVPVSPHALDALIAACLAKDPDSRWRSAHDVALQLRAIAAGSGASAAALPAARPASPRLPWAIATVALGLAAAASILALRAHRTAAPAAIRFPLPPPPGGAFRYSVEATFLAISPDGSRIAYIASEQAPSAGITPLSGVGAVVPRIYLRELSSLEARAIPGTEGAISVFFSPDGRSLGFSAQNKIMRLELAGGAPVPVCETTVAGGKTGTWGADEMLFAGMPGEAIYRVAAAGGTPVLILKPDASRGEVRITWPWFLPDGKRFLYSLTYRDGRRDLMLGEEGRPSRVLMPGQSMVQFSEAAGALVFVKDGSVLGQRFDWKSGRTSGGPFSISGEVRFFFSTGSAEFATSRSGALVYQTRESTMHLAWFDRQGKELSRVGPPGGYLTLAIDREGHRVLFDRKQPGLGTYDLWIAELDRGTETRVTTGPDSEFQPVWLSAGSLIYSTPGGSGAPRLYRHELTTGRDEELLPLGRFQMAQDVSPDGKQILYVERTGHGLDAFVLPLDGKSKPAPLLPAIPRKDSLRLSPDGRLLAFVSDLSGQAEAYVAPYPGPGEATRVSTGGATLVRWDRANGGLVYLSPDNRIFFASVSGAAGPTVGSPEPLFSIPGGGWLRFEIAPDGRRFLAIVPELSADELPLTVVTSFGVPSGS